MVSVWPFLKLWLTASPVLRRRDAAPWELLKDRTDVYVIEPFSSDAIATAIEHLYRDRDYRLQLGQSGCATVASMLSGSVPVHGP